MNFLFLYKTHPTSSVINRPSISRYQFISLILISVLLFGSCKDNSSGSEDLSGFGNISIGNFSAEVSGDLSQTFSGIANFATQIIEGPTADIFVLTLSSLNTATSYTTGVTFLDSSRPATGDHSIGSEISTRGGNFTIYHAQSDSARYFSSQNGELSIILSTSESLQGTLTLRVVETGTGDEVIVTAQFNANCHKVGFTSCE